MSRFSAQTQGQIFVQNDLLEALKPLYSESQTDQDTLNAINGGICYMLSMEWIRSLTENPNAYPDSIFDCNFAEKDNLLYFKQVANNYCTFKKSYEYTFFNAATLYPSVSAIPLTGASRMESTDRKFIQECSKNKMHVMNVETKTVDSTAARITALPKRHGLLLWLQVYQSGPDAKGRTMPSFAHEMALWRAPSNQLYFFDPNEGVFRVDNVPALVTEIFSYSGAPAFPINTPPWLFTTQVK